MPSLACEFPVVASGFSRLVKLRDGPLEKLRGGLYDSFLGRNMNIFLG